jgi:hypothetical protein
MNIQIYIFTLVLMFYLKNVVILIKQAIRCVIRFFLKVFYANIQKTAR